MSDARTPILYIAPWVGLGGSDRGTIDWFKNIDRERWAPSLITTTPSPNRWLHHVEPYAEEIWDLPDLMPGAAFPEFVLGFIESRGVRLVHIMNSRLGFDLLPDMTCLPEPPAVVVQLHAEEPNQTGYVRYVTRRYGNLIDAFSVVSEDLKQTIAEYEIPPSRIEVIHLGVDGRGEFDPARVEPLELPGNGAKRILWPGRLVEQKDPLLTMEVLARARERGVGFVLDVVGDGHLKEPARERAEELGVADIIEWHPPSQEMARWYRSTDLVLMTSVYEGIPLVVYEALAMGIPVVAPALPGNVELMDADSGALVEPRDDVDRYADAIVALLGDDERRGEMGARSRARMLSEFSLAEMGSRHDALYERLLSERTASSRWRNEELFGAERPARREPSGPPPTPLRLPREPLPERTVGVIVPCYRHGIFLDGCIASVKAQTLVPTRIVVVDDGSKDAETVEALGRFDDDPEVTVLRQAENAGPSAARNRALAELETSYFLPIDADDELLPDALERMLAQLEAAPEDVGFVYPSARHIGNQVDEFAAPAYNTWLLMEQNYCAAPALFDRRVFADGGVSYPEEIVVGHEDWDLVLQLAERDVRGIPAAGGPTFLYRKQGFSRVHAVDYGPESFHKTIEGRHPHLYARRDEIKATWAPALTIVLLDEAGAAWDEQAIAGLELQSCCDFELLGEADLGDGVRRFGGEGRTPAERAQEAIDMARGRFVLLLPRSAAAAFGSRSFVEQLIHAFAANPATVAVVLAESTGPGRPAFAQLDDSERLSTEPAAIAFERPLWGRVPPVVLGLEDSLLADLVVGLRIVGPVQWRALAVEGDGSPWRTEPVGSSQGSAEIEINAPAGDGPEAAMRHMVAHQSPRLPEMTPGRVRRWRESEPWTPPQTRLLCRHLDLKTGFRMVTPGREPPPGHRFERVLGCTHLFHLPGTRRLIHAEHSFALTDNQGALEGGQFDMGYVEQQPLPLLEGLELRRTPDTGQEILVAGPEDPLIYNSEPVEFLGWIEACPILPRAGDILHTGPWAVVFLRRRVDGWGWRHRYRADPPGEAADGVNLGALLRHAGPNRVALRLREDGRLASELCVPGRASRDPRKIGRWLAQPLRADGGEARARAGAAGARLGQLTLHFRERRLAAGDGVALGYLSREMVPGCSTLYSTIHPVTGDQLVTSSPQEATDAGYVMDGILGAIFDPPPDE